MRRTYQHRDVDVLRWTWPPSNLACLLDQDREGNNSISECFGSAHSSGFQMVFCDGSVTSISYSIDPKSTAALATAATEK